MVVRGVVQGVGFRPFVYATAAQLSLAGQVCNDSSGVIIEVEGDLADLDEFGRRVTVAPPPLAIIDSVEQTDLPASGAKGFRIASTTHGVGRTWAAPDVAMCADCVAELRDPTDRRYRHPFINCTHCGPRFTIIAGLPYDRARTSMADFALCGQCAREYSDPANRRFHAQPIACHDCGPALSYHGPGSGDPIAAARELLRGGEILAVKGIGGYHLACDATNAAAVARLRTRKRRGNKPFAVMVADLGAARAIAEVDDAAARLLCSPARPIVLVRSRDSGRAVAAEVAPGVPDLGVLLAYTPLHLLLFGLPGDPPGPQVLVMTSGNRGGEPICFDETDAHQRLVDLADGWLGHNRRILVPCDDSVVRVAAGRGVLVRRSRGYAPLPVPLPFPVVPTLAVGADGKNACAVATDRYAWLSQHLGDLDDLATLQAFGTAEGHLEAVTGVHPTLLAADAHPEYRSTAWAHQHAGGRPVHTVTHHHAHIAAVMGEHGLGADAQVLGIAFDGTGFGRDGAIWGGEVFVGGYRNFRRVAHLRYVPLAGGEATIRRPYRMALAHLWDSGISWTDELAPVRACPPSERKVLAHQLTSGLGCVPTSSMGRLFDAVAALAGVRQRVDFEAQAAIELEGVARDVKPGAAQYQFVMTRGGPQRELTSIDARPVIAAVAADAASGVAAAVIGARFHESVAVLVCHLAVVFATNAMPVALSGGVFQNALLLSRSRELLQEQGFCVLTHHRVPPNDGGLALGQLLIANANR